MSPLMQEVMAELEDPTVDDDGEHFMALVDNLTEVEKAWLRDYFMGLTFEPAELTVH